MQEGQRGRRCGRGTRYEDGVWTDIRADMYKCNSLQDKDCKIKKKAVVAMDTLCVMCVGGRCEGRARRDGDGMYVCR